MRKSETIPPRGPNRFRERELSRTIRGIRKGGEQPGRVEIDPATGKISVILTKPGEAKDASEVESWLSKQGKP
jgi:hypothetical protein